MLANALCIKIRCISEVNTSDHYQLYPVFKVVLCLYYTVVELIIVVQLTALLSNSQDW